MRERGGKRKWETTLEETLADPRLPLHKRGIQDGHKPEVVNMVATVSLQPLGSRLPLETLATHLGPCSQYAPQQFAANIFKLGDSTGLLFSSGKLLLTAALTNMHVLYASHYFRLCIESVPYRSVAWVGQTTSAPAGCRTTFDDLSIHNIVGHGHFRFAVDLERLRATYPASIEWVPDNFPAARCKVWVHEDQRCHCGYSRRALVEDAQQQLPVGVSKHLKRKCRCIIKCLVFAKGSIVMIGGKATENVNYVFQHMKRLCRNPAGPIGANAEAPLLLRLPGVTAARAEKPKEHISASTAIALAMVAIYEFKDKTRIKPLNSTSTMLMHLADAGRLEAVRYALTMEPDQVWQRDENGQTAAERLRAIAERSPQQEAVLELLERFTTAYPPAQ